MRGRSDEDDGRRGLLRGREERPAGSDIVPQGYLDAGGVTRAVQGDREAPWLRTPPFPSDVVRWFTATNATPDFIDDYAFTDPIQVTDHRILTLWLEFTHIAGAGAAVLSLVPQAARRLEESTPAVFRPIAVIDPTLAVVDLSATVIAMAGVGSRTFRPAELRTASVATIGQTWRTMLPFDVTPYTDFRFAVGAIVAQGVTVSAALDYSFAE